MVYCEVKSLGTFAFQIFSNIIAGIQLKKEIHNENRFLDQPREIQFQLKSEEIAKKIPNGDIMFINGKEEKNIKKSKNTNEHLHSQTNEHLHKTR